MRTNPRLEALETKDTAPVNQINPRQIHTLDCTYCQALKHIFEEYHVIQAHQMLPENMNATYSRPHNNPNSQTYNPG